MAAVPSGGGAKSKRNWPWRFIRAPPQLGQQVIAGGNQADLGQRLGDLRQKRFKTAKGARQGRWGQPGLEETQEGTEGEKILKRELASRGSQETELFAASHYFFGDPEEAAGRREGTGLGTGHSRRAAPAEPFQEGMLRNDGEWMTGCLPCLGLNQLVAD